jgi:hypothetical protein
MYAGAGLSPEHQETAIRHLEKHPRTRPMEIWWRSLTQAPVAMGCTGSPLHVTFTDPECESTVPAMPGIPVDGIHVIPAAMTNAETCRLDCVG